MTEAEVDCAFIKAWVGRDVVGASLPCASAPAGAFELEDAMLSGRCYSVEDSLGGTKNNILSEAKAVGVFRQEIEIYRWLDRVLEIESK